MKNMITGAAQMDGAILVVSRRRRPDAADPRAHPARPPGRRAGAGRLSQQGRHGRTIPKLHSSWSSSKSASFSPNTISPATRFRCVKGSALMALEGKNEELGRTSIGALMKAVDEYIPQPERRRTSRS